MVTTARIHPGARQFDAAACRQVADGDPFDRPFKSFMVRQSDGRDLLAALLWAAGKHDCLIAGGTFAARKLGLDVDANPRDARIAALNDLSDRGDRGEYAGELGRVRLRRDLLGEEDHDG